MFRIKFSAYVQNKFSAYVQTVALTFRYFSYAAAHCSASCGMNSFSSMLSDIMRRISHTSLTMPDAFACTMTLPRAVPSCGPASTRTPVAFDVNWLR